MGVSCPWSRLAWSEISQKIVHKGRCSPHPPITDGVIPYPPALPVSAPRTHCRCYCSFTSDGGQVGEGRGLRVLTALTEHLVAICPWGGRLEASTVAILPRGVQ